MEQGLRDLVRAAQGTIGHDGECDNMEVAEALLAVSDHCQDLVLELLFRKMPGDEMPDAGA
jgi:hypothetical protein